MKKLILPIFAALFSGLSLVYSIQSLQNDGAKYLSQEFLSDDDDDIVNWDGNDKIIENRYPPGMVIGFSFPEDNCWRIFEGFTGTFYSRCTSGVGEDGGCNITVYLADGSIETFPFICGIAVAVVQTTDQFGVTTLTIYSTEPQ